MTYLYVYCLSPTSSTLFTTVPPAPRTGPAHSRGLKNEFVKDTPRILTPPPPLSSLAHCPWTPRVSIDSHCAWESSHTLSSKFWCSLWVDGCACPWLLFPAWQGHLAYSSVLAPSSSHHGYLHGSQSPPQRQWAPGPHLGTLRKKPRACNLDGIPKCWMNEWMNYSHSPLQGKRGNQLYYCWCRYSSLNPDRSWDN